MWQGTVPVFAKGAELKHEEFQCEGGLCPHQGIIQASYKKLAQVKSISR